MLYSHLVNCAMRCVFNATRRGALQSTAEFPLDNMSDKIRTARLPVNHHVPHILKLDFLRTDALLALVGLSLTDVKQAKLQTLYDAHYRHMKKCTSYVRTSAHARQSLQCVSHQFLECARTLFKASLTLPTPKKNPTACSFTAPSGVDLESSPYI